MSIVRAVVYTRVSTQDQAEGVSLETQLALARSYCQERGWLLTDVLTDTMSGRSERRPQFRQLEEGVKAKRWDAVLVYKLDRLARSTSTFYRIASLIQEKGVKLVSLTETIDFTSPEGKAMVGMLAIFAEIFSDQLSQRVRGAMATLAAKGQWLTGAKAPIGYELIKDEQGPRLVINEAEAVSVRDIFATFLQVRALRRTCERLHVAGIRTKNGYHWQSETLRYLLRNPVYVGASAWGKYKGSRGNKRARIKTDPSTWVVTEGTHEPIIDRGTWDEVQRILNANQESTPRRIYSNRVFPWTGIIKCCGLRPDGNVCASAMNQRIRRYGNGGVIHEYYCNTFIDAGKAACPNYGRVTDKFLEWEVIPKLEALLQEVASVQDAHAKAKTRGAKKRRGDDPTKRLAALEARREREKQLFREGFSTFDEMAANIKKLDTEIKELGATAQQPAAPPVLPASLSEIWGRLEPAEQGDLLRSFVAWCEADRTTFRIILRPFDHPAWPETLEIPIVTTRWHQKNRNKELS